MRSSSDVDRVVWQQAAEFVVLFALLSACNAACGVTQESHGHEAAESRRSIASSDTTPSGTVPPRPSDQPPFQPDRGLSASTAPEEKGALPSKATGDKAALTRDIRFPAKWSQEIELASLDDAGRALAAARPDDFYELVSGGEKVQPSTCLEWEDLHGRGFVPSTTLAAEADEQAKVYCESLKLLERARGSASSYVRDLPWNARLLAILPPAVATAWGPEEKKSVEVAAASGLAFDRFDPKAGAKYDKQGKRLEISEPTRNAKTYLYPLIWADLTGDGVEDIAISVMNVDQLGPMTARRLLVATREAATETLRIVAWR